MKTDPDTASAPLKEDTKTEKHFKLGKPLGFNINLILSFLVNFGAGLISAAFHPLDPTFEAFFHIADSCGSRSETLGSTLAMPYDS